MGEPNMRKSSSRSLPSLSIRIDLDTERSIGPGKIRLLESILSCGSISAAGREMNMSYKRAWDLVDEINRICRRDAVERQAGGKKVAAPHSHRLAYLWLRATERSNARRRSQHARNCVRCGQIPPPAGKLKLLWASADPAAAHDFLPLGAAASMFCLLPAATDSSFAVWPLRAGLSTPNQ
jgi:molybdenum-dependent DNA-binding transcriptional regulator ModE